MATDRSRRAETVRSAMVTGRSRRVAMDRASRVSAVVSRAVNPAGSPAVAPVGIVRVASLAASPARVVRVLLAVVAVRILGRRLGGRSLAGPKSRDIRPTSDRLRESLFNVLMHRHRDVLEEGRVLDLFAGTGALGLEALSRGASLAVLVDEGFEARGLIRQNIESLGLGGEARLLKRDATRLGIVTPFQPFSLLFCDPPYGRGLGEAALASVLAGGWLAPGGLAVLEETAEAELVVPAGLEVIDRRAQGDTQLVFARRV